MITKFDRRLKIKLKNVLDRICATFLLILLIPVFILIAIGIKIDDGSKIFFIQFRPGLYGKPFKLIKFRSMIQNADLLLDERGSIGNVNRITRVGKILRKLSLDELPQLINIVKGEMSFVGPRPSLIEQFNRYTKEQKERFVMKPGITGLAQINGRNTLKWSKRIEYDIEYIRNYSLSLDFWILLKTFKVVLYGEGIVMDRNAQEVDDLNGGASFKEI